MFVKVKIDRVKLLVIFISLKSKEYNFGDREDNFQKVA